MRCRGWHQCGRKRLTVLQDTKWRLHYSIASGWSWRLVPYCQSNKSNQGFVVGDDDGEGWNWRPGSRQAETAAGSVATGATVATKKRIPLAWEERHVTSPLPTR